MCRANINNRDRKLYVPFDSEACNTRLLSKYTPTNTLDIDFSRGLSVHLLIVIFVVDVVPDTNEFPVVIAAR